MENNQNTSAENQSPDQSAFTKEQAHTEAEQIPKKKRLLAALSYLGIFIIIPYLVDKENPFVKFHIKQGLVLFIINLAVSVISFVSTMAAFTMAEFAGAIISIAAFVLSVIGIINVIKGEEKELPLVGHFASRFTF